MACNPNEAWEDIYNATPTIPTCPAWSVEKELAQRRPELLVQAWRLCKPVALARNPDAAALSAVMPLKRPPTSAALHPCRRPNADAPLQGRNHPSARVRAPSVGGPDPQPGAHEDKALTSSSASRFLARLTAASLLSGMLRLDMILVAVAATSMLLVHSSTSRWFSSKSQRKTWTGSNSFKLKRLEVTKEAFRAANFLSSALLPQKCSEGLPSAPTSVCLQKYASAVTTLGCL